MTTLSYFINWLVARAVRLCEWGMVLCGAAMAVVILMQVFFRFVVYVPVPWTEEVARYLMVWMGMLGSVAALKKGRHIGVRVLVEKLPGHTYDYVVPFVQLCMIAFFCILGWQSVELIRFNSYQLSPAMEISMTWPYAALPIGAGLMALVLVGDMLQDRFPTEMGTDADLASQTLADSRLRTEGEG